MARGRKHSKELTNEDVERGGGGGRNDDPYLWGLPNYRMMAGVVLYRACKTFVKTRSRKSREDARGWLFGFGGRKIIESFGWDASWFRKRLIEEAVKDGHYNQREVIKLDVDDIRSEYDKGDEGYYTYEQADLGI